MSARTIRVGAVQVASRVFAAAENLDRAGRLVAEAAARGAQIVLCPEFLAAGYLYEESIWEAGEPAGGPTERLLADLSRAHGILVGASFLEAEGDDFFNTFSLFSERGLVGRVRKRSLPFFEGWFFTPCARSKVIETDIGRVAVGICNDNQTLDFLRDVAESRPDLILMPHSAPSPIIPVFGRVFSPIYEDQLRGVARRYASAFGIPVVMVNKASAEVTRSRLPIAPAIRVAWTFAGQSTIVAAGGREIAHLGGDEGVLVEDVVLDPAAKKTPALPSGGYWSFAPRGFPRFGGAMMRAFEALGQRAYARNARRRAAARACSRA